MKHRAALAASTAAGFAAVLALHLGAGPAATAVAPSGSTPTTPSTQPPSGSTSRSAVGPGEQYGYGVLSVKATVRGSQITGVSVANLQTAESYSQSLAQQVIPILHNEVLAAQSAKVNGVSGATYTSLAYLQSLQSALDTLHA